MMKFLTQLLHLFNSSKKKVNQRDQPQKEQIEELTKLVEKMSFQGNITMSRNHFGNNMFVWII